MSEHEISTKQMKDMLKGLIGDGKREAKKKLKEDRKSMFDGIRKMHSPDDGRYLLMRNHDIEGNDSDLYVNTEDDIEYARAVAIAKAKEKGKGKMSS